MTIQLYQFQISHYCEKVRFALSYKGLDYQENNLLPGFFGGRKNSLAGGSAVPVISHEGLGIQGSGAIISYLDERFPERCLTPVNLDEQEEALEWERWMDQEVGIAVRVFCYYHLFEHPALILPMMASGCKLPERIWLRFAGRRVMQGIRDQLRIDSDSAQHSLDVIRGAADRLSSHLRNREFMVGAGFSRADLAAAALLSPMFRPDQYGFSWPDPLPPGLAEADEEFRPQLTWARETYRRFRDPATGIYQMPDPSG